MLFFYNYAKSLIKCIFIIFAFILICFLFWFYFCFRMVFVCNLMHIFMSGFIFQFVLFVQNFIFQTHFYFQIWTNAHIKKLQRFSAIFIFDLKSSSAFSKILPVDRYQASCLHRFSNPNHWLNWNCLLV